MSVLLPLPALWSALRFSSRWLIGAVAVAAVAQGSSACSGSSDAAVSYDDGAFETVLVSSPESIALGPQRLILLLKNGPIRIGGPDQEASVALKALGSDEVVIDAEWVWSDEATQTSGAWIATHDFPSVGTWRAVLTVDGQVGTDTTFRVQPNSPVPRVGEQAPRSENTTLDHAALATLTTDPAPDRRLYERSVAESIESGRATALIFSTPEFCTTEVCGPLLDVMKSRIERYPDVNFVHVEVYEDVSATNGELIPRQSVPEWGIATEPWVFFIDGEGMVRSVFEGVVSSSEIDRSLDQLAALAR